MLTVSLIDTPRKNSNARRVYFGESGEYEKLPQQVIKYHDIAVGMTFDDLDAYHDFVCEKQYDLAKNRALRILSRSEKTTYEVQRKLYEDGYFEKIISEVLSFLEEYKLCDDFDLASRYIEQQLSMGTPSQKIKYKLIKRGISKEIIQELILDLESDEFQQIQFQKGRDLIQKFDVTQRKESEKALRKLVSKGYSFDDAKKIINSLQEGGYCR